MAIGDPYITGTELEAYLPTGAMVESSASLTLAANAASRWVEGWCRRQFNKAATSSARLFPVTSDERLWVDDIATSTVTIGDGTDYANVWDTDDYQLIPIGGITYGVDAGPYDAIAATGGRRFLGHHPALVQVTAVWGWPEVPEDVKQATYIQAGRLFKRRESLHGVLGSNDFGTVRVGTRVDPDVADLLARYRLFTVA